MTNSNDIQFSNVSSESLQVYAAEIRDKVYFLNQDTVGPIYPEKRGPHKVS